jgi:two-component system chemotaxis response regulator CheB
MVRERPKHVVVVAGSAGSLTPLKAILAAVPPDGDAAVIVVVTRPGAPPGELRDTLAVVTRSPIEDAHDGQPLLAGTIYVVSDGADRVSIDETRTLRSLPASVLTLSRPPAEPLLASAANAFGDRSMGVVLSGLAQNGGEAGLVAIKRAGGETLVQAPREAEYPAMPLHALMAANPRFCGPVCEIAQRVRSFCDSRVSAG